MKIYAGTVRLDGSVLNEVQMSGITAPEVLVLRAVHGDDALSGLREIKSDKREHGGERERLALKYGYKVVQGLFGPAHADLPTSVRGVNLAEDEAEDDKKNAPKRRRSKKPPTKAKAVDGVPAPQETLLG